MTPVDGAWVVVVPVKDPARGKSRLDAPGVDRIALARAIALDALAAVAACDEVARVVVVTDDAAMPMHAAGIAGVRWIDETAAREHRAAEAIAGRADSVFAAGLDGAIAAGMAEVDDAMPRAALLGDLPALRPDELAVALREAASVPRGVAADAEGTGSTLVTAGAGVAWASSFGDGSFARHLALGCVPLATTDAPTLHRDVDTIDQLEAARTLGLGPRTTAVLERG
ncbi:2-phospho-L-lactate guanylyltransferase [Microbacterium terrae]|uniref:2-phospho-L-lactate guanylyltransferase n=1 Tax=Microbacterium terrae TaxID=69369 RepID=A0A0M2H697_9MICO|nr:hypothetical protein [Microbacterium terrae]KJL40092.1 2-phospho-L-lactate guanylyltransferase [Microbacterium terrae]MBP1079235.1 2-phospho-L-lactate guanylyltransferase [Microbacterium terrae]GLJ98635.1 2-phospho-L-lactate guanylyltransferase [Microbacterium terrae]